MYIRPIECYTETYAEENPDLCIELDLYKQCDQTEYRLVQESCELNPTTCDEDLLSAQASLCTECDLCDTVGLSPGEVTKEYLL